MYVVPLTTHHVARNVVGDDPVGLLAPTLCYGMLNHILCFGGEADEQMRPKLA